MELSTNAAYNVTCGSTILQDKADGEMELSTNAAYNVTCGSTILQDKADGEMELSTNTAYNVTCGSIYYTPGQVDTNTTDVIITAPNKAYEISDIPASSNQAYEMVEHYDD